MTDSLFGMLTYRLLHFRNVRIIMFNQSTLGTSSSFGTTSTPSSANPMKDFEVTSPPDDSVSALAFSPATIPQNFLICRKLGQKCKWKRRCWCIKFLKVNYALITLTPEFIGCVCATYIFGNRESMMYLIHAESNMGNIIVKVLLVKDNHDFIVLFYVNHLTCHWISDLFTFTSGNETLWNVGR